MTNIAEIFLRSSVFATLGIEWEEVRMLDFVLMKRNKKAKE